MRFKIVISAIVALGNPGARYEFTRHNFGWLAADRIEDSVRVLRRDTKPSFNIIYASHRGTRFLLCRPTTYMNHSGIAVDNLMRNESLVPEEILVIHDDIDIEFGFLRLRQGGGDGGHKGIRSIIRETGTRDFARLRIGIKPSEPTLEAADFVLSQLTEREEQSLEDIIIKATESALDTLHQDMRLVMNRVNRRTE